MGYPRYWYVINTENNTSYVGDESECFSTEADAIERAKQLAKDCPGDVYEVVSTDHAFVSPIGDVVPVTIKK